MPTHTANRQGQHEEMMWTMNTQAASTDIKSNRTHNRATTIIVIQAAICHRAQVQDWRCVGQLSRCKRGPKQGQTHRTHAQTPRILSGDLSRLVVRSYANPSLPRFSRVSILQHCPLIQAYFRSCCRPWERHTLPYSLRHLEPARCSNAHTNTKNTLCRDAASA